MPITVSALDAYLRKEIYPCENETLKGDSALFSSGMLDSFHLVELVAFIESEAQIKINPMEVTLHNLDSINRILDFVSRKTNTSENL